MSAESQHPRQAVDRLYVDLAPLPVPAQMRTLSAWARTAARPGDNDDSTDNGGDGRLRPLLDELDTRGAHGRRLAVIAASIGGDVDFVAARLADSDSAVRSHALKSAQRLPISDTALEEALDDAPEAVRRRLITTIATGRRTALAERLLPSVRRSWGDAEAARLLPGCGPELVGRLLPDLFRAVARWRPLARRHPDLVLDEITRRLAELPEHSRTTWWQRNADVFEATVRARPHRVLELLERHAPARLPGPVLACLGRLLKAEPARTIRLITAPHRRVGPPGALVSRSALRRVALLDPPELVDLGRAWNHSPGSLAKLLRALPPSRREAFYDAVTAGTDLRPDDVILDVLPHRRAQSEARELVARATERGERWNTVLASVMYLPVAEARPRLLAATRRPAAEDRALAYPMLVRNVARFGDTDSVTELLDDLQRLRNEQEPVRSPALSALSETPPRLFIDAHATLLDRIATDAVEARDSSGRTRQALSALALALLREHAAGGRPRLMDWALATVKRVSGPTGGADLGRLDTSLRKGQEFEVFEALRPWLESGADRVDHSLTFALVNALGRRARHMPELQDLLWQAIQFGNNATVLRALWPWLDAPSTRDERTGRVVGLDPSTAVLDPVLRVLTRRRTDLLHLVLGDTPPHGHFLRPGAHWVPPIDDVRIWLPHQQAAAARLLGKAAGDASLPEHVRAGHLRNAAEIPEAGFEIVRRYLDSPNTVLAEAAMGALVWTDRPAETLPLLLSHAADDRARVALYAAARATRFIAPSRLETVLRAALLPESEGAAPPKAKVTSRKELLRLVASRLPVHTAAPILLTVFGLPDQHRDVQAACVPLAAELLDAPDAWTLLERAADGPPVTQAAILRTRAFELRDGDRSRYAQLVGRVSGSSDVETADAAMAVLAHWAPWYPEGERLLLSAALDLDNRTSWRAAADGLVALTASPDGAAPLLEALTRLAAAEAEAPARHLDAEVERDRPARQRIGHLVARLSTAVAMGEGTATKAAALRASDLLGTVDDFLPQAAQLSAKALRLNAEAEPLLDALKRLAALHADRPVLAADTAEILCRRLNTARRPGDPGTLLFVTERLTAEADLASGLLAVAVTEALGPRTGWTPEWRTRLRTLRRHPHPDVREAALTITTAAE